MSWSKYAKEALARGETTQIKPKGNSMSGRVENGQIVTLDPPVNIQVDDVVLVRVSGRDYLHLVKAIEGDRYLIGNNKGGINGWVGSNCIYGKMR